MSEKVFLVALIARLLQGRRHVVVGANLPIPAAAALLAHHLSDSETEISILSSRRFNHFHGIGDLHSVASQGGIDGFFMSPGQIDGQANINLVGVGDYPKLDVRWPGSHGTPLFYMTVPNVILFRTDHKKRIFVPKVDFISAAGTSPPNVFRPGGPSALVTNLGYFSFDRAAARFRLESVNPGHSVEEIIENTGFAFDRSSTLGETQPPAKDVVEVMQKQILPLLAEIYPQATESLRVDLEAHLNKVLQA